MIEIKNLLVATDFSEVVESALTYGRTLATRFGATLHLLHVAENVLLTNIGPDGFANGLLLPELQREVENTARKQLDEQLIDNDPGTRPAKGIVVTSNRPAEAIVEYARVHSIDLIVMGTHGRGFMSQLLMGSVAERVVRTAPCPVLTVHHPEHEFVVPDALVAASRRDMRP